MKAERPPNKVSIRIDKEKLKQNEGVTDLDRFLLLGILLKSIVNLELLVWASLTGPLDVGLRVCPRNQKGVRYVWVLVI